MIGKEVPPGMLGGDQSPESQEGPSWSLRRSGWTCTPSRMSGQETTDMEAVAGLQVGDVGALADAALATDLRNTEGAAGTSSPWRGGYPGRRAHSRRGRDHPGC